MKCWKHKRRAINNKLAVPCAENQLFTTWLNLRLGKINTAISTASIKAKTPPQKLFQDGQGCTQNSWQNCIATFFQRQRASFVYCQPTCPFRESPLHLLSAPMVLGKWTPWLIQEVEWSMGKPISTCDFPWPLELVERWACDSNRANAMRWDFLWEFWKTLTGCELRGMWEPCKVWSSYGEKTRAQKEPSDDLSGRGNRVSGHHLNSASSQPSYKLVSSVSQQLLFSASATLGREVFHSQPFITPVISILAFSSLPFCRCCVFIFSSFKSNTYFF